MKKIKFTLAAIAITVGIAGAFAFSPAPVKQSSAQYYTDAAGNPQTLVNPLKPCANTDQILCSATFTVINGQPTGTGSNPRTGPRPN